MLRQQIYWIEKSFRYGRVLSVDFTPTFILDPDFDNFLARFDLFSALQLFSSNANGEAATREASLRITLAIFEYNLEYIQGLVVVQKEYSSEWLRAKNTDLLSCFFCTRSLDGPATADICHLGTPENW